MATRRSLEERIQIVLLYGKFENFSEIRRQWKHNFTSEAPSVETISAIVKRFKETGSLADLPVYKPHEWASIMRESISIS